MDLQLFLTLLLVILSWFLAQDIEDAGPFLWWTGAWSVTLVLLVLGRLLLSGSLPNPLANAATVGVAVLGTAQVPLFGLGGRRARDGTGRPAAVALLGGALLVGLLFGAITVLAVPGGDAAPGTSPVSVAVQLAPRSLGLALALPYCAYAIRRSSRFGRSRAALCVVIGFLLYGLNHAVYTSATVNEIAAFLAGRDSPAFGAGVLLSEWAFRADVAWEALIGIGSVLLLRREGREARRALDRSETRYRRLFEDSADGILLADSRYRVSDVNSSLRATLGLGERSVEGIDLLELIEPSDRDGFPSPEQVFREDRIGLEATLRRRDGESFEAEISMRGFGLEGGSVIQVIIRDVTERKQLERRLARRALLHPLTDLPNRYHFNRRIEKALAQLRRSGPRLALLFVDLDDFKSVNDTLGHAAGDELLQRVAEALQASVRSADLVGHVGGDEFTVLLHDCEAPAEVREAAVRLRDGVEGDYALDRGEVRVSLSVGGAVAHRHDTSDELLHRADTAMYRAKGSDERAPVLERESPAAG